MTCLFDRHHAFKENYMNYGQKIKYILISAVGMYVIISGIAFKVGYFPGHSGSSAIGLIVAGVIITIWGLAKLKNA